MDRALLVCVVVIAACSLAYGFSLASLLLGIGAVLLAWVIAQVLP